MVALYILNHKRDSLAQLESRYGIHVLMAQDDTLIPPAFRLERLRAYGPGEAVAVAPAPLTQAIEIDEEEPEEDAEEADEAVDGEANRNGAEANRNGAEAEEERGRARRRRRRRRRHEDEPLPRGAAAAPPAPGAAEDEAGEPVAAAGREAGEEQTGEDDADGDKQRRRRGRRGGRRRGRREDGPEPGLDTGFDAGLGGAHPAAVTVELVPTADDDGDTRHDGFEFAEGGLAAVETAAPWAVEILAAMPAETPAEMPGETPAEMPREMPAEMLGLAAATEIETASLPALAGEPADAAAPGWNGAAGAATQRPEPIVILDQASGNAAAADPHPPGEIAVLPLAAAAQDSEPEPGAPLLTAARGELCRGAGAGTAGNAPARSGPGG